MAYTLPNGLATDWSLHAKDWKPGTDRNWKVTDFFIRPWIKKQIDDTGDLPGSPANGDAYLINGTEVHRWNANTSSYDVFILDGAFIFYDEFNDSYYSWTFGDVESLSDADDNSVPKKFKRVATATNLTTSNANIIGVTSTAAPRTITIGSTDVEEGFVIIVKDESGNAGTNNITVATEGSETIDGVASVTITSDYGVVKMYSDGTNWFTF